MIDIPEPETEDWRDGYTWKFPEGLQIAVGASSGSYYNKEDVERKNPHVSLTVSLPHQCDRWEIVWGDTGNIEEAKKELDDFIAELKWAREVMDHIDFEEIEKKVLEK